MRQNWFDREIRGRMRSTAFFICDRMKFDRKIYDRPGTIFLHDLYRTFGQKSSVKNQSITSEVFYDRVKIDRKQFL